MEKLEEKHQSACRSKFIEDMRRIWHDPLDLIGKKFLFYQQIPISANEVVVSKVWLGSIVSISLNFANWLVEMQTSIPLVKYLSYHGHVWSMHLVDDPLTVYGELEILPEKTEWKKSAHFHEIELLSTKMDESLAAGHVATSEEIHTIINTALKNSREITSVAERIELRRVLRFCQAYLSGVLDENISRLDIDIDTEEREPQYLTA